MDLAEITQESAEWQKRGEPARKLQGTNNKEQPKEEDSAQEAGGRQAASGRTMETQGRRGGEMPGSA